MDEPPTTAQHPLSWVLGVRLAHPGGAEAVADRFDPGGYTNNNGALYVWVPRIPTTQLRRRDCNLGL